MFRFIIRTKKSKFFKSSLHLLLYISFNPDKISLMRGEPRSILCERKKETSPYAVVVLREPSHFAMATIETLVLAVPRLQRGSRTIALIMRAKKSRCMTTAVFAPTSATVLMSSPRCSGLGQNQGLIPTELLASRLRNRHVGARQEP